jgi:hypothetical protein
MHNKFIIITVVVAVVVVTDVVIVVVIHIPSSTCSFPHAAAGPPGAGFVHPGWSVVVVGVEDAGYTRFVLNDVGYGEVVDVVDVSCVGVRTR